METGSQYGIAEEEILHHSDYIFVGNDAIHATKPILHLPHQRITHRGLRSRATPKAPDFIAIWQKTSQA